MIIGIAPGCFDGLHDGHRHLLRTAKAMCNKLVVALNADDSVRRLKGEGRPIKPMSQRMIDLMDTGYVNTIMPFFQDTPYELLTTLGLVEWRPMKLFKGDDYDAMGLVEGALIRSWGGEVVIIPRLPGFSTTRTVEAGKV